MSRGDNLRAYRERKRAEGERNHREWLDRSIAAREQLLAATGLPVTVNPGVGGFTLRLEDVEQWLANRP